jgi:hypothetical protein
MEKINICCLYSLFNEFIFIKVIKDLNKCYVIYNNIVRKRNLKKNNLELQKIK